MLIELKKQATETIEIKTPFYCKDNYAFSLLTDAGDLIVVATKQITIWTVGGPLTRSTIQETMEKSVECNKEEFDIAFGRTSEAIAKAIGIYSSASN